MRKLLLVGLVAAAPILVASTETVSACGWGYSGYSSPRYYGYTAPRYYGYTSYAPRRFYGARVYGWRAGLGVRRWGWRRW